MIKTLRVTETKRHLLFQVLVTRATRETIREVARFSHSGMGWVALGASGRYLIEHMMLDHIEFCGTRETYQKLVDLGVIQPREVGA